jgi:hypothetical protein
MSPRSRKRKIKRKTNKSKKSSPVLYQEYYQPIFRLLIGAVQRTGYDTETPHPLRKSFWHIVPPGKYSPERARPIIGQYLSVVEKELGGILSRHSIAYWLHIHRRLSPTSFGPEMNPKTVYLIRATLEAAIQKYARMGLCDGIGLSNEVSEQSIMDGALLAPEFKYTLKYLRCKPQLVLIKFGLRQLIEFYDLEKLAYDIWRCAAVMRTLGKGAPLIVVEDPIAFYDGRSDELDRLVTIYDKRRIPLAMSATGTVFSYDPRDLERTGFILLPALLHE